MTPRRLFRFLLALGLGSALSLPLLADGETAPAPSAAPEINAGPYRVIMIDHDFLQDVSYRDGRIYLKRQVNHRDEAITLRASVAMGEAYRKWFNGEYDLVSPAHAGHAPNAWTDWVETTAPYVEYWVGDKKVLHLRRVE